MTCIPGPSMWLLIISRWKAGPARKYAPPSVLSSRSISLSPLPARSSRTDVTKVADGTLYLWVCVNPFTLMFCRFTDCRREGSAWYMRLKIIFNGAMISVPFTVCMARY